MQSSNTHYAVRVSPGPLSALKHDLAAPRPRPSVGSSVRPNVTFGELARDVFLSIKGEFRSTKHREQWIRSLEKHAWAIWTTPVADVDVEAVRQVLQPIWSTIPETASRVRGRIERVLDAATALDLRHGPNPAQWTGRLKFVLAKRRLRKEHFSAMPYAEVPGFLAKLRRLRGLGATALEFTILTAARSGEVLQMRWDEIHDDVWIIPGERMKAGREHRVPLVGRALEILRAQRLVAQPGVPHVFPSRRTGHALCGITMIHLLSKRRLGITVHGFRSAFRDWAGDNTDFPEEVIETALAHSVGDAVRRAYRRGDSLERRRALMAAWDAYCAVACHGPLVEGLINQVDFRLAGHQSARRGLLATPSDRAGGISGGFRSLPSAGAFDPKPAW